MIKSVSTFLALIAVLTTPMTASAGPIGLDVAFSDQPLLDSRNLTFGWTFTVTQEITVDALGTWDHDANGLSIGQVVSIWSSTAILLGQVFVDNTATPVAPVNGVTNTQGQWLQQDVADFVLGVGDYVIGTSRVGGSGDPFLGNGINEQDNIVETDPRLAYTGFAFDLGLLAFPVFQGPLGTDHASFFGPTFWIADDTVAVPEPATLALLGLGLSALGFARRRQKR